MDPITDPDLIRQLEDGGDVPSPPAGMTAVDPTTAKFLDGISVPWYSRLGMGLGDPFYAGAQMGARIEQTPGAGIPEQPLAPSPPDRTAAVDAAISQRENNYQSARTAAGQDGMDWWRMGGNLAAQAPFALAPGGGASFLGRAAANATLGGLSGMMQPVPSDQDNFGLEKLKQGAGGAAMGAVLPMALGAVGRVVQPNVSPDIRTLVEAGVNPTVGQLMGGTFNRAEQGMTSVPILGDFIKNARRATIGEFDRGGINQALAPIGEKLEAKNIDRSAIAEMQSKIGNAYDRIVPDLGITTVDPATGGPSAAATQLHGDISAILDASTAMPAARAEQLRNIIQSQIYDKMSPGGGMTGESFQEAKSALGKLASDHMNSSLSEERQLGGALLQTQVAMRDALRTANPAVADQLSAVDNAFAHSLRINNAAGRMGGDAGMFTPAQLDAATKALDPTLRKRAFAAGDALMQNYAEAGKNVLGNTVPDSGTPYRHALEAGLGLLGAHALGGEAALGSAGPYATAAAMGAGIGAGTAGLAYSPFGRALATALMARRPQIAAPISNALRGVPLGSFGGPIFGALAP